MIRLVLVLGAGLFAAMLIGGQDHGQLRFGLMAPKQTAAEPAVLAANVVAEPSSVAAVTAPVVIATPVIDISFAPSAPVMTDLPVVADTTEVLDQPQPDADRILLVSAKSVNVRDGPGKDFAVVSRLSRGEAVLVVSSGEGPDSWSLIRIEGDGVEGYVASRFLAE